jgi:hypothetical protein
VAPDGGHIKGDHWIGGPVIRLAVNIQAFEKISMAQENFFQGAE